MTIAVKRYTSLQTSAPTLTGQVGSLVSLLDACLVNGFNSKTVTLTQTAGTATASCNSHGFNVNDVVVISGANESAWNDEFLVLTAATNSFTFAIGSGTTSPATGTITAKIAPLGWTKPFSGTNKAAYLPQSQYVQCYLRVLDDSTVPTSASGRWAKIRGYETMTDVDTGTGLFPTTAQATNGLSVIKSSVSDASTRAWYLVGDGGIFYLGTFWATSTYAAHASTYLFGDINSLRSGDAYSSAIMATTANSDTSQSYPGANNDFTALISYSSTSNGKYIARPYMQVGSSVACGSMGDNSVSSSMGNGGFAYPHPPNNGLIFAQVAVVESSTMRSRALPGLYYPLHTTPLTHLDLLTDLPDLPGRTLQAYDSSYSGNRAQLLFDITGPWR